MKRDELRLIIKLKTQNYNVQVTGGPNSIGLHIRREQVVISLVHLLQ